MIPPSFDYATPQSLSEAIALLHQHGSEAKVLAGGHSLIPAMRLRFAEPSHLIDISGIAGLSYIRESDGFLRIGAMTREVELEDSELIQSNYPILLDTAKMIADPQVRNLATLGGNLAHGDPANDHPATMLALRAHVEITGQGGNAPCRLMTSFRISSRPCWNTGRFSPRSRFRFHLPTVVVRTSRSSAR